jgi:hypothetical protein
VEAPVFLAASQAALSVAQEHWPKIAFHTRREHTGRSVYSEGAAA